MSLGEIASNFLGCKHHELRSVIRLSSFIHVFFILATTGLFIVILLNLLLLFGIIGIAAGAFFA